MNLTVERVPAAYRYISCLITSVLYLTVNYTDRINTNIFKMIVILMLWTMTVIINGIYLDSDRPKYGVAIMETVGLTLLLIPTGGLDSPFIWYALNTVLLLGSYKILFSWLAFGFYLSTGAIISAVLYNPENIELTRFLWMRTERVMVFVLIIIAIRFLTRINKELSDQTDRLITQQEELINTNARLICANEKAENSIRHVMSLYQIMQVFSGHDNISENIYRMVEYANGIIGSEISLSWTEPAPPDHDGMLAPIESATTIYGYLVVKDVRKDVNFNDSHHSELLRFLADLIAVVLERNHMEKVSNDLAILEEQKRIANEIHDNVSQRIFSVVCAAHALNANLTKYDQESIREKLMMIEGSTKEIGNELRAFIYRLSPEKNNMKSFYDSVRKYLNEFSSLNNIKIDIDLRGEAERLGPDLKLAFIRIIREASGNAVRHGECTKIKVMMNIEPECCSLKIEDNGSGFRVDKLKLNRDRQGLGVNNMKTLTEIFNGTFHLSSIPGKGTKIRIEIPLNPKKSDCKERESITCIS